jgi:hypothetical protein
MSITTPSPVRSDKLVEFFGRELSDGAATNLLDHMVVLLTVMLTQTPSSKVWDSVRDMWRET